MRPWQLFSADVEGAPLGLVGGKASQWQRSLLLVVLPCFQRATVRTKLNLETRLYRSQFPLIQVLAWHKGTDTHTPMLVFMGTPSK